MKKITVILAAMIAAINIGYGQYVNWRALNEDAPNIIQLNTGYDYGATAQLGYSRSMGTPFPLLLQLDYSFPMGNDLTDDFKVRLGGAAEVFQSGGFSFSVRIASILRRYQSDMVRIISFGSDFVGVAGYYTTSWYASAEYGFDKSITSEYKHSEIMRAIYPEIRDGWYIPNAGHFIYGLQVGKTIGDDYELSIRFGGTNAQGEDVNATIPYYLQLGLGMQF
jgi:hypothetical protein